MEKKYFLKAKLLAFKETNAIFEAENGNHFSWPIKNLPDNLKIGQQARLIISTEETEEAEREKLVKEVLNQIIRADDDGEDEEKENKP